MLKHFTIIPFLLLTVFLSSCATSQKTGSMPLAAPQASYTTKEIPVAGDKVLITDSEDSWKTKNVLFSSFGGSGDMILNATQSVTGAKTFDPSMLLMKGSSTGVTTFATANAGASNYTVTFPAATGTVAYISDTAYDATSWNAVTDTAPTKNAVRDAIEALPSLTIQTSSITTGANNILGSDYGLIADTDGDGLPNKVDLASAGLMKVGADGVVAVASTSSDYNAYDADLTTWSGITPGSGVGTFLATPSSANLASAVTGETGSGALVFDTSPVFTTSLALPQGSAPTVDAAGETAVDTTSDQFVFYGTSKRVLPHKFQENFAVKTPVDADDFFLFKAQQAITITDIHVITIAGTSIAVDIQECDSAGANCATVDAAITADTDGAEDDGTLSNGTIDAGDWVKIVLAAPSGTVNYLTGSIYYTITAD